MRTDFPRNRVRPCSQCGVENPDSRDFCTSCGAFLDAEPRPPRDVTADGAPADATTSTLVLHARSAAQEPLLLQLFYSDGAEEGAGGVRVRVAAGGRVTLKARVRNQSNIVNSYRVKVVGLPDGWWSIDPPTAYLLPMSERDGYEAELVIALHPPRTWQATAGPNEFTVVATSETHALEAESTAIVNIEPFSEIAVAARPIQVGGRRGASLVAGVENSGNSVVPVLLTATDAGDRLRLTTPVLPLHVAPGPPVGEIPVHVKPKQTHWIGTPIDHQLNLVAYSAEKPELKATTLAAYRQRAWIPWWLPFMLLMLAVIAVVLYLLWPHHVKVPDVRKEPSPFAAQKRLEKAGLTLNPKVRTALRPRVPAGTVIAQAPAAGKTVDKGKQVTVVVAAGHHLVRVPKLRGMKLTDAEQRLRTAKLTLGAVQPKLVPGARIASQLPHAGARRREGTAVSVVLAKKKPPNKNNNTNKKKGPAKAPAIPPGASPAAAAKAIKAAGLKPVEEREISEKPRDTVLATVPAAGVKPADGIVRLRVSAGFPQIAYDTGVRTAKNGNPLAGDALVVGGFDATPRIGISRRAAVASRGAWSADGKQVAFVHQDHLYVIAPTPGAKAKPVYIGGRRPTAPSFAPRLKGRLLVFADAKEHVCWIDLAAKLPTPSCKRVAATSIEGFAWSPQGTVLLVAVTTRSHGFGLMRLATHSPFASDADQWAGGHQINTRTRKRENRGVRAASFSPDGTHLAMVSNLSALHDDKFVVSTIETQNLERFDGPSLDDKWVAGCDVDWRPDGLEWLVVQAKHNCGRPFGKLVRVSSTNPSMDPIVLKDGGHRRKGGKIKRLPLRASHAAYQPIDLSPGPAQAPVRGTRP